MPIQQSRVSNRSDLPYTDVPDRVKHEEGNILVICIMLVVCFWIVFANGAVTFVCLSNKACRKNFFSNQILSLSITDLQVGISCLLVTSTYIFKGSFVFYNACAFVFFYYFASQHASLYHTVTISFQRFFKIFNLLKPASRIVSKRVSCSRVFLEIALIWASAALTAAIPFILYPEFDTVIPVCSLNGLFHQTNEYKTMLTIECSFLLAPQLLISFLYCALYIHLTSKWQAITGRANKKFFKNLEHPAWLTFLTKKACYCCRLSAAKGRLVKVQPHSNTTIQHLTGIEGSVDHSGSSRHVYKCKDLGTNVTCLSLSETGMELCRNKFSTARPVKSEVSSIEQKTIKSNCFNVSDTYQKTASFERPAAGKESVSSCEATTSRRKTLVRQNIADHRRVFVTIGIILLVLNVCMTPLDMVFVIEWKSATLASRATKFVLLATSLLNSAINPLIYAFRIRPFRKACITFIRKLFRR